MDAKKKNVTKFPKGFFTNIKCSKIVRNDKTEDYDKPFEWSEEVKKGKTKVILVRDNN